RAVGACGSVGGHDQAISEYRRAAARRCDHGDAWWSLANLKTYRFTQSEIEGMAAAEATVSTAAADRWHLCFALGSGVSIPVPSTTTPSATRSSTPPDTTARKPSS